MTIDSTGPRHEDETPICIGTGDLFELDPRPMSLIRIDPSLAQREDETPICTYTVIDPPPRPEGLWMPFGDWLVRRGLLSSSDLFSALQRAFINSSRLGDEIVEQQILAREQVEEEARAYDLFLSFGDSPTIHETGALLRRLSRQDEAEKNGQI